MELKQKLKPTIVVVRSVTSPEVLEKIEQGKKFIVVKDNFDPAYIPDGSILIDMKYDNSSFKTLVPQNLLYFLANPGEGDSDDALNEIGNFYDEIQAFEDTLLEENRENIQGTNWAVTARNAYSVYLINKLTRPNKDNADRPEWNEEMIKKLDLNDEYIDRRIRAIAAICLEKTAEEIEDYGVGDILKHITVRERTVEELTLEEFDKITCWAGSHYELKDEYRSPDVQYIISVGQKITEEKKIAVFDAKIKGLEKEIQKHRKKKGSELGEHDISLIRTYINLRYIAGEDPQNQLEIKPNGGVHNE